LLAAGMAVLAPIAFTVGGALSAYAGYSLVMAKFGMAASTMFGGIGTGMRVALVAIRGVGMALLTSPIFWIGAAIAGVAYEIYRHWDGVKAFFGTLWGNIKGIFSGATEFIAGVFTGNFTMMFDGAKKMFRSFADFVQNIFNGI